MTLRVTPLPVAERMPLLDILRGFALMGILVMNMPFFGTSFFAEADGSHLWPGRVDQFVEQAAQPGDVLGGQGHELHLSAWRAWLQVRAAAPCRSR